MSKEEKTTRIFTGSAIEAQPLINALNEIDINPIIRDDHQSGILSVLPQEFLGKLECIFEMKSLLSLNL